LPTGFKLLPANPAAGVRAGSQIQLCERGKISFWGGNTTRTPAVDTECIGCTQLDATQFAHTYAPRMGEPQAGPVLACLLKHCSALGRAR